MDFISSVTTPSVGSQTENNSFRSYRNLEQSPIGELHKLRMVVGVYLMCDQINKVIRGQCPLYAEHWFTTLIFGWGWYIHTAVNLL